MNTNLNVAMNILHDTRHIASMKPNDWVKFLPPMLPKNDDKGELIKTMIEKGEISPQKLIDMEQRYLHLVREKVIQGNICGVGLDTRIYRIMKCADFHESLKTETLFLTNPLKWAKVGDSWENSILSGGVYRFNKTKVESVTEQVRKELKKWYGQSWSLVPECDAFWKRYTVDGNRAVRISTTVGKLLLSIFNDKTSYATTFMDSIRYLSESEIEESKVIYAPLKMEESFRSLLTLKRAAYAYEKEVRLMYFDRDEQNMDAKGQWVKIPVRGGLLSFIESIEFDPNCPQSCLEAENSFLHEHGYVLNASVSQLNTPSLEPTVLIANNVC